MLSLSPVFTLCRWVLGTLFCTVFCHRRLNMRVHIRQRCGRARTRVSSLRHQRELALSLTPWCRRRLPITTTACLRSLSPVLLSSQPSCSKSHHHLHAPSSFFSKQLVFWLQANDQHRSCYSANTFVKQGRLW